jgi:hypothetical protein
MSTSHFKTILPGVYLSLVAICLIACIPSFFTDKLSFCSGTLVSICLPYGIIGIIILHLPLVFVLGPLLNYIDGRNIYPGLAVLFFTFFLLNLVISLTIGFILDHFFFKKPREPSSVTNQLQQV